MAQDSADRHRTAGPHGLGDPDDTFLRKVELEVLIPKKMRDKSRAEKCQLQVAEMRCIKFTVASVWPYTVLQLVYGQVLRQKHVSISFNGGTLHLVRSHNFLKDFSNCAKESGLKMVVTCQDVNAKMKECLTYWFRNPEFRQQCTEEYLKERAEFRSTGISKKQREFMQSSSRANPA